jgi:hypothetical protein
MPTPNSKTNLIFHYRHSAVDVRLVVMNKKIEVYSIDENNAEAFHGYLNVHSEFDESFSVSALEHIATEIKRRPLSIASFEWLDALQYQGFLKV